MDLRQYELLAIHTAKFNRITTPSLSSPSIPPSLPLSSLPSSLPSLPPSPPFPSLHLPSPTMHRPAECAIIIQFGSGLAHWSTHWFIMIPHFFPPRVYDDITIIEDDIIKHSWFCRQKCESIIPPSLSVSTYQVLPGCWRASLWWSCRRTKCLQKMTNFVKHQKVQQ